MEIDEINDYHRKVEPSQVLIEVRAWFSLRCPKCGDPISQAFGKTTVRIKPKGEGWPE